MRIRLCSLFNGSNIIFCVDPKRGRLMTSLIPDAFIKVSLICVQLNLNRGAMSVDSLSIGGQVLRRKMTGVK